MTVPGDYRDMNEAINFFLENYEEVPAAMGVEESEVRASRVIFFFLVTRRVNQPQILSSEGARGYLFQSGSPKADLRTRICESGDAIAEIILYANTEAGYVVRRVERQRQTDLSWVCSSDLSPKVVLPRLVSKNRYRWRVRVFPYVG